MIHVEAFHGATAWSLLILKASAPSSPTARRVLVQARPDKTTRGSLTCRSPCSCAKERGETVVALDGPYIPAPVAVDSIRYPLLSGIDPYGKTIFNRGQMDRLTKELRHLLTLDPSPTAAQTLTQIGLLCQRGQSPPHQYLWFVGD